jgi:hypothetical protein
LRALHHEKLKRHAAGYRRVVVHWQSNIVVDRAHRCHGDKPWPIAWFDFSHHQLRPWPEASPALQTAVRALRNASHTQTAHVNIDLCGLVIAGDLRSPAPAAAKAKKAALDVKLTAGGKPPAK